MHPHGSVRVQRVVLMVAAAWALAACTSMKGMASERPPAPAPPPPPMAAAAGPTVGDADGDGKFTAADVDLLVEELQTLPERAKRPTRAPAEGAGRLADVARPCGELDEKDVLLLSLAVQSARADRPIESECFGQPIGGPLDLSGRGWTLLSTFPPLPPVPLNIGGGAGDQPGGGGLPPPSNFDFDFISVKILQPDQPMAMKYKEVGYVFRARASHLITGKPADCFPLVWEGFGYNAQGNPVSVDFPQGFSNRGCVVLLRIPAEVKQNKGPVAITVKYVDQNNVVKASAIRYVTPEDRPKNDSTILPAMLYPYDDYIMPLKWGISWLFGALLDPIAVPPYKFEWTMVAYFSGQPATPYTVVPTTTLPGWWDFEDWHPEGPLGGACGTTVPVDIQLNVTDSANPPHTGSVMSKVMAHRPPCD
jgi:hypothetical protein